LVSSRTQKSRNELTLKLTIARRGSQGQCHLQLQLLLHQTELIAAVLVTQIPAVIVFVSEAQELPAEIVRQNIVRRAWQNKVGKVRAEQERRIH